MPGLDERSVRVLGRILDANTNRAIEGLRVCEEVARFILEHRPLTRRLRTIRHELARAVHRLDLVVPLTPQRDVPHDIGRVFRGRRYTPGRWQEVFLANASRVKEALRVLEEFGRLLDVSSALYVQRIRFRFYAWEQAALAELARLRYH